MSALIWAIGATFAVSLIAFVGIFSLALKDKLLRKVLFLTVGFSAGALMGAAFLHLIPEAVEKTTMMRVSTYVLAGFLSFFLLERVLYWHHCHKEGKCPVHMFTYMNLIGDSIHNFIDGLVIAASFIVNVPFGIITTLAIIAHEIPQELGDFGVLVYGGFTKLKALAFNFLTALTAILGAVAGFYLSSYTGNFTVFLVPFAAGGFIYIAASDLVPELHKESDMKKSMISFLFFLIGVLFMYFTKVLFGG